jgi:hypothetical protein
MLAVCDAAAQELRSILTWEEGMEAAALRAGLVDIDDRPPSWP